MSVVEITVIIDHPDVERFQTSELRDLVEYAISLDPGGRDLREIAVLLTTDQRLRGLHRDFMGLDSETDVMTFPAEREPGAEGRAGDVVISVDRAAENSRDLGHSPWEEIRFLTVHGILHLCGWDDHDDEARARMLARQAEIIGDYDARR